MSGLHVLIANIALLGRSGTEVVAADIARALAARGHHPVLYSPHLGEHAAALRAEGLRVVDSLDVADLRPDIIHGQHNVTTVTAMVRFARVPAVFVCHDATSWHDEPPMLDRIRRYIAVDEACRERLVAGAGIAPERVSVLLNAVDLVRFARRAPLPSRPLRALALTKNAAHLPAVREACRQRGIALDELGPGVGLVAPDLERLLPDYDVVFATARMAIESLAVGVAVVACDARGFAGMVTTQTVAGWRARNFGWTTLTQPTTAAHVLAALDCYDPVDAARVTDRIRAEAGLDAAIDRLEAIYREVLAAPADASSAADDAERRALAVFLARWLPDYRAQAERESLLAQLAAHQAQVSAQGVRLSEQGVRLSAQEGTLAQQQAALLRHEVVLAQLRTHMKSPRWLLRQIVRALKGKAPRF
jgi:hypothetical protein